MPVPVSRLIARMGLSAYDVPAPYTETGYQPDSVTLLLRQHVGKPAVPVVRTGDRVHAGRRGRRDSRKVTGRKDSRAD